MKRYLIVDHYLYGTYQKDAITRDDLAAVKMKNCEAIVDVQNGRIFDPELNTWKELETR